MSAIQQRFIDCIQLWTVKDLKVELNRLRVSAVGDKEQLVTRLRNYYLQNDPDLQPTLTPTGSAAETNTDGAENLHAADLQPTPTSTSSAAETNTDGAENLHTAEINTHGAEEHTDTRSISSTPARSSAPTTPDSTHNSTGANSQPTSVSSQLNQDTGRDLQHSMHATNPNTQNLGNPNVPVQQPYPYNQYFGQGGTTSHNVPPLTYSSGQMITSTGYSQSQLANQPHTQGMSHIHPNQSGYPMIHPPPGHHIHGHYGYQGITPNYMNHTHWPYPYHSMHANTGGFGGTPPYPYPGHPDSQNQSWANIGITPNAHQSLFGGGQASQSASHGNHMSSLPPPTINVSAPTPTTMNQGQAWANIGTTPNVHQSLFGGGQAGQSASHGNHMSSLPPPAINVSAPILTTMNQGQATPNITQLCVNNPATHLNGQPSYSAVTKVNPGTTPHAPTGSAVVVQPSQLSAGTILHGTLSPSVVPQSFRQVPQVIQGQINPSAASNHAVDSRPAHLTSNVSRGTTKTVASASFAAHDCVSPGAHALTASQPISSNFQGMQTPMSPYHGDSLLMPPNVASNLASTRYDHATPIDPQSELSALETELKILHTKEQIKTSQLRLALPPEELLHSSLGMTSSMEVNTSMLQLVKQSVDLNSLPPTKPFKFSGDILEYPKWNTLFDLMVEGKSLLPHQKLVFLSDYLSGEPLDLVRGYCSLNSEEAYKKARKELQERYGDPVDITEAYRDRLEDWPRIGNNDAKALRKYSDFLSQCELTMSSISELCKLSDPRDMKRLPHVLPDRLVNKWSSKAGNMKYSNVAPTFNDYAEFVKKEAFMANSNTTSVDAFMKGCKSASATKPMKLSSKSATALATQTHCPTTSSATSKAGATSKQGQSEKPKFVCHHCSSSENHNTADCFKFSKIANSEQQDFMKSNNLCFRCLRKGHSKLKCHTKLKCKRKDCDANHATCFHDKQNNHSDTTVKSSTPESISLSTHSEEGSELTTMILPVYVSSPDQPDEEYLVYAMVDSMSNTTYISSDIASRLNMKSRQVKLKVSTLTSQNQIVQSRKYSHLRVRGMNSDEVLSIPQAFSQPCIPGNKSHIPTPKTASRWDHLKHMADKITPLQTCDIGLLIGYNCPAASCPKTTIENLKSEPYAVETALGWSIVGGICRDGKQIHISHRIVTEELLPDDVLKCLQEDLTVDHTAKAMSQNDIWFMKRMGKACTTTEDGFYSMPLPLKVTPKIPDNRSYSMRRFKGLERKLKADSQLDTKYREFMTDIISKGEAQVCSSVEPGWYIPHHGVFNPHKPGKLRVVFDCSASYQGHSLNKLLIQGPDLNNNLAGLLCRFRKDQVAVTCDIQKMFHQFRVAPEHRKFIRFLWYKEGSTDVIDYQMNVHLFGATSSPSCAIYGLQQLARDHASEFPQAADFIRQNFYVDDGLISLPTAQGVISLMEDTVELAKRGNLVLHKFLSNNSQVAQALGCDGPSSKDLSSDSTNPTVSRALGLIWDVTSDSFKFTASSDTKPETRRGVLSTVAAIFDPLGFLTPFTLKGKLILQRICSDGMSWDDPLSEQQAHDWKDWMSCLPDLTTLQFPRCFLKDDLQGSYQVELHVFSDASTLAYGVCAYLRVIQTKSRMVNVALVIGKSRVAPKKVTTIPRLELQAATLAIRVSDFIKHELQYQDLKVFFWTDSETVLGYISNDSKRFHIFVANRVQRIRDTSSPSQWNYVSTTENPADVASRGSTVSKLPSLWSNGPDFLHDPDFSPPVTRTNRFSLPQDDPEIREVFSHAVSTDKLDILSWLDSCNSWNQVTRYVSRLLRFLPKTRRFAESDIQPEGGKVFSVILKLLQKSYLGEEVEKLSEGLPLSSKSPLSKLDPFIDDHGILRVGGRLTDALCSYDIRHPAVMPGNAHTTKLYALHKHAESGHQGKITTINHIRASGVFIYSQGNRMISTMIYKCIKCIKLRGQPQTQKMANLPTERLQPAPPFTHCGMDVFGPFLCKDGRKQQKRYGLIFCCLASRAVHLELLDDMSTDCFINSFRCFTAIRGPVQSLLSDQGTNFVGAKNEMDAAMREMMNPSTTSYLQSRKCSFRFNVPSASNMGGSWERLIRTVRNVLKGLMIERYTPQLDSSSFRTLLYECMAIVNSRPLTTPQLCQDSTVEPLPLTPNMLLTMKDQSTTQPPGNFSEPDLYSRKRWRRIQYLAQQFWCRWKSEYLNSLQTRQKWNVTKRNLAIGDIVLLTDDDAPRSTWGMAVISETFPSKDGLVRKVRLHMGAGRYLDRPIHKLVLLIPSTNMLVVEN